MRFVLGLASCCVLLVGCEQYTEKKSPCFGNTGKPIVARAAQSPLTANSPTSQVIENENYKDCVFEELGKLLE